MQRLLTLITLRAAALAALASLLASVPAVQAAPGSTASAQTGSRVEIASPSANTVVRGVVQITGTAIDPNFRHYELDWAPDPPVNDSWTPVQPPVAQQVQNGILGVWDTTTVPDGLYLIRLRLVRHDELTLELQVRVQVSNATPTPRPSSTPLPTPTPRPGTPTPGPSPTPLIWQPPTRTPRPTAGPGTPTVTPVGADSELSPFNPARLRSAACSGAWLTLLAFVALGVYGSLRGAARGPLRVWWWRFLSWLRDRGRRSR